MINERFTKVNFVIRLWHTLGNSTEAMAYFSLRGIWSMETTMLALKLKEPKAWSTLHGLQAQTDHLLNPTSAKRFECLGFQKHNTIIQ